MRDTLTQWMEPQWDPETAGLAAFAGTFRSEELDVEWTFAVRDGQLVVRRPRFTERVLTPGDRDAFRFKDPFEDEILDIALAFQRDTDGQPNRFLVTMTRADNLLFTRVPNRS